MSNGTAAAFVEARRTQRLIRSFPGKLPVSLVQAYRIQDTAIAFDGRAIGGWKVGRIADAHVHEHGALRLAGPIFADQIAKCGAVMPVLPGFAAVEAELLVRLCAVPPGAIDRDTVRDHVAEVCFGLEIASSPYPEINARGPAVTVSDFGNNYGLVLGPQIPDWPVRDLLTAPVTLDIDGIEVGAGTLAEMLDGPFGAIAFLIDLLASRGRSLTASDWISTGAITGVHPVQDGQSVHATFDGSMSVSCDIVGPAGDGGET